MASEDSQWEWMDPAQNGFGFKVPGDNAWYDSRNDMVGPDGRMWARVGTQDEVGMAPDAYTQYMQSQYGIDVPSMTRDGAIWAPHDALVQAASKANAGDGFMQKFLNGPGPVLALSGGLLGAVGAAGGFSGLGASGLEGAAGSAAPTVAEAGAFPTTAEGLTFGNAPGINLPGSGFLNVASDAAQGGGSFLGPSIDTGAGAFGGAVDTGLGSWSAGTTNLLGMTPAEMAAIQSGFTLPSNLAGAGLAAGTAGGAGGADGLFGLLQQGLGSLPPGTSTLLQQALQGGNGPTQAGYNPLDPSTYGGGPPGLWDSIKNGLSGAFPNANLGSLLTGAGQGILGYLGSKQQADAIRSAQESQNAALQKSIDFAREQSDKYYGMGAPYRDLLAKTYQPGYSIWDDSATRDAATQAADLAARSYSSTSGNPFDQPSAQGGIYRNVMQQVALPQLNTSRSQLGTFGQLGTNQAGTFGSQAAQGMAAQGNNAFAGVGNAGSGLEALGAGLATAINPPLTLNNSMADLLKNYKLVS